MEKLKLEFIEDGRLSNEEMTKIGGGESCDTYKKCEETSGKSECTQYRDCWFIPISRTDCGTYYFVVD